MEKIKQAIIKSAKSLFNSLPLIFGTVALVSLLYSLVPKEFYISFLSGKNQIIAMFLASIIGSISAGNAITSYIIGGELLKQGVSLVVVTAFLVAWVTVGFVQLPAESAILGKKFAIWRNITAFLLSLIVALITIILMSVV